MYETIAFILVCLAMAEAVAVPFVMYLVVQHGSENQIKLFRRFLDRNLGFWKLVLGVSFSYMIFCHS